MKNIVYNKRQITFPLFAAAYKDYFDSHVIPDGVDTNFKVQKTEFIETALMMNRLLADNIKPLCQRASRHLHHSRLVMGMFFEWMLKNIRYATPFPLLCICSVITHFTLHYFEKRCYRFALLAPEFMAEVLNTCYNDTVEPSQYAPFGGFRTFCDLLVNSDEFGNISSMKVNGMDYNLTYSFERFPKNLLRQDALPLTDDDSSEDEQSKKENTFVYPKTPISPKRGQATGASHSKKSPKTSPMKSSKSPKSLNSAVLRQSSGNIRKSYVCKRCKMDCRGYIKKFIYEYKSKYSNAK